MKKERIFLMIFFIITLFSSFIFVVVIHESIHIIQADFKISQVCFFGYDNTEYSFFNNSFGWVNGYNFKSFSERIFINADESVNLEEWEAYTISTILFVISIIILTIFYYKIDEKLKESEDECETLKCGNTT